ncbi:hypothetical protein AB0L75_24805 [Streptomyces sp. NPDC052101]|uniref:hypothetical protein n=1 Tax=Streptomyces sp. NPDC052101 TaxID=3155763 RepID=UPI0034214DD8
MVMPVAELVLDQVRSSRLVVDPDQRGGPGEPVADAHRHLRRLRRPWVQPSVVAEPILGLPRD